MQDSVFAQTFHGPSLSQNKTPVEVFGWRNLPFTQKRAIKYESWTAFAHWKQIEQAFLDWFGKQDSVFAQTFHGPSVPQNKTHVKVLGSNYLPFWEIKAINSKTWTLFACWKQIEQFFFCLFGKQDSVLAESLHGPSVSQNKTPVKVFWFRQFTFKTKENNKIWNFDPFWPAGNKLTNFFCAYLECRIQFWLKVCMAFQCHKIKLLWRFLMLKNRKESSCPI